jgi:ABC-type sugar transport system ATPase subunit
MRMPVARTTSRSLARSARMKAAYSSMVEPTGSETQVVAKIGSQELVCVFRERITARPGEMIGIAPDPALVHLFDGETGARIN